MAAPILEKAIFYDDTDGHALWALFEIKGKTKDLFPVIKKALEHHLLLNLRGSGSGCDLLHYYEKNLAALSGDDAWNKFRSCNRSKLPYYNNFGVLLSTITPPFKIGSLVYKERDRVHEFLDLQSPNFRKVEDWIFNRWKDVRISPSRLDIKYNLEHIEILNPSEVKLTFSVYEVHTERPGGESEKRLQLEGFTERWRDDYWVKMEKKRTVATLILKNFDGQWKVEDIVEQGHPTSPEDSKKISSGDAITVNEKDLKKDERVSVIANRLLGDHLSSKWKIEVRVGDLGNWLGGSNPNGKIVISSKYLQIPDDEMALLLGHEIAHVLLGHDRESDKKRFSRYSPFDQYYYTKFTREQEFTADEWGMKLLIRAGYNPNAALNLYKKEGEKESQLLKIGTKILEDPSFSDRLKRLSEYLEKK